MHAAPASTLLTRRPIAGRLAGNWHRLFVAVGSALVLLLLALNHWQATASIHGLTGLQQQTQRVEHLDSLLIQLMDAENAVRGYLLSGNRTHLEPYAKSQATVSATLNAIRRDVDPRGEYAFAFTELAELVEIKLGSLDQAVARGIAGEETRVKGKRATDSIRDTILALKAGVAAAGAVSYERSTRHVERSRWVVATLALGALALMAVLLIAVDRQVKLREQLADLLQSENQRLDALVQERTGELSDLASYLTNTREVEKARLARELHDELGALLTAAKMESGWISRQPDETALASCRERLARIEEHLDGGIALKRRIIDNLRPPLLEMLGLVSTLRALGEEFSRDAETVRLTLELPEADLEIAPEPALALFRIAQEALTNIRKHAQAQHVKLALRETGENGGWLELKIEDDGVGFRSGPVRGRHHGLAGMKHRVQMFAGEFSLDSRPGAGTRIVVRIPAAFVAGTLPEPAGEAQDGKA